jgi:hypothetical protein
MGYKIEEIHHYEPVNYPKNIFLPLVPQKGEMKNQNFEKW